MVNTLIWIFQAILCFVFLGSGILKLSLNKQEVMEKVGNAIADISPTRIKLTGLLEVLGAVGIILPRFLGVLPTLTAFAAFGLALTMLVALVLNLKLKDYKTVIINVALMAMAVTVAVYSS